MKNQEHSYIVIMAGGSGTRLWPLSRKGSPKQFQKLLSDKTMIEETFERALQVVPEENIYVSTTFGYRDIVLEILPQITPERLILEPEARNTGPAIALVSATIHALDSEAVVATVASDHAIVNSEEFTATMIAAFEAANIHPSKLITVGINATFPDTGMGYIKMGDEVQSVAGKRVFTASSFKEKPDQKTAEGYLSTWEYLWNASYFIFRTATFSLWTEKFSSGLSETMRKIMESKTKGSLDAETLSALYRETPAEPFDTLIVERLAPEERLVIPSALKWSDVGNWSALFSFLQEKTGKNLLAQGKHIDVGSHNLLVHGKNKTIATLGLEDMVIVDTDDALLVANKEYVATDIKKLLEKIREESPDLLS